MCAGFFSNPFDVIKTRQQLQGELERVTTAKQPYRGLVPAIRNIFRSEGIYGLQKGLCSALAFQFVMNSTRLGLFETVDTWNWTRATGSTSHSPILCVFWGGVAGVAGSAIGCPFYMVKTQIQAQSYGRYAVGFQHNHKGTVSALKSAYSLRGVRGLWKGVEGIVPRTAVGSAIQLSTFTSCKDFFMHYEVSARLRGTFVHRFQLRLIGLRFSISQTFQKSVFLTAFAASMVSGFFLVVGMTPFDVVATRLFNQGTYGAADLSHIITQQKL